MLGKLSYVADLCEYDRVQTGVAIWALQSHAMRILMGQNMSELTLDSRQLLELQLGLLLNEGE